MAREYIPNVKYVERYKALRKKGMSKDRAARIASLPNTPIHGARNNSQEVLAK